MRKREVETVQMIFKVPRETRDEFKVAAAKVAKTMTQVLEDLMKEFSKKSETTSK